MYAVELGSRTWLTPDLYRALQCRDVTPGQRIRVHGHGGR